MASAKLPFITNPTPFSVEMYHAWFNCHKLDLETYRVTQVNHYKDMGSLSQHEKIIAKVTTAENNVFGYLSFERNPSTAETQTLAHFFFKPPKDPDVVAVRSSLINDGLRQPAPLVDDDPSVTQTPERNSSSSGNSVSSSHSTSMKSVASDTVAQVSGFPSTTSKKGMTLVKVIKPRCLLLSDLVTLAWTIHSKKPLYAIFKNQCYWFASMVMCILQRHYEGVLDEQNEILAEKFEDEVTEKIGGTWKKVRVHQAKKSIVDSISTKFEENLDSLKLRVSTCVTFFELYISPKTYCQVQEMKDEEIARQKAEERAKAAEERAGCLEETVEGLKEMLEAAKKGEREALEEVANLQRKIESEM
jgi:hypothetical protein